jgi:ketosteroid isomerase-like protein
MSEENVEIVRRLYDAVARRDAAEVLSLYDPEVEWDGSRHAWSSVMGETRFHGHEGIRKFSRLYYETWESLDDNLEELIDADHCVVSLSTIRARGRRSGIEVEWKNQAGVWTIRDGKIVRIVWFPTREEALEAAGLTG